MTNHRAIGAAAVAAVTLFNLTAPPARAGTGSALSFNGSDQYVTATIPSLANNYTVSAWINLRNGGQWFGSRTAVLSAPGCGDSAEVLIHTPEDGSTPQRLFLGRCNYYNGTNSTLTIPSNQWTHIAVTVSAGNQVSYFINGIAAGSWDATGYYLGLGGNICLAYNQGSGRKYDGLLDDVQVWSRALNQAEIRTNMNQTPNIADADLVAYWPFDEGAGTAATADASGHGHTGTLVNSPAWTSGITDAFTIATGAAAMGFASDGLNSLIGLENHQTTPTTIGAQLLSGRGTQIGSLIPTGRSGIATAAAFDGTNYLLIWEDDGMNTFTNAFQVYGQFISKDGAAVGSPFAISAQNIWFDGIKTMAFGGGQYLVTYTRLINVAMGGQSTNRYIAGRMVSPDGTVSSEFRISTGYGKASDVAFDGANFFVVWCEDYADYEIRGRFVSPSGVPGTEISVNASAAPSDNPKSVTFDGSNYLVIWNDEVGGASTYTWDVFGQRVSTSGALVGGVITITSEAGPQMGTSVASDGINSFAVWADMQNGTNWNVYGQFISRSGTLIGSKVMISTNAGNQMGGADFANGKYLVTVNNGIILGEDGISQVDSATGQFLAPLPNPQVLTSDANFGIRTNRFGFTMTGISGQTAVVEACTNLAAPVWVPLFTNTFTGGSAYFSDSKWTNYSGRYYRLRLQ